jgi:phage/plasmid-like protein (TIGR03299 family)
MPHMVESMWSGEDRAPWWHGLDGKFATVTSDKGVNWSKALRLAQADWKVRKYPLYAFLQPSTLAEATGDPVLLSDFSGPSADFYGLVREDTKGLLYVVGGRYVEIQNAETFQWASNILDSGGLDFVTAWVLREGRCVGCTLQLPKGITVGGASGEELPTYLNVLNWHGGGALEAHISHVRVECQNTLTSSQRSAQSVIHIRHTANATQKLEVARKTLGIAYESSAAFETECNELLDKAANQSTVIKAYESVWTKPDESAGPKPKAMTRWKNRLDEVVTVWGESPNLANVRDTQWGVYNAFTEWSQWGRKFRGSAGDPERIEQLRAEEVLFGQARSIGEEVFDFLREHPATSKSISTSHNPTPTRKVIKKKVSTS